MIMILNDTIMLLASASGERKKQTSKKKKKSNLRRMQMEFFRSSEQRCTIHCGFINLAAQPYSLIW